MDDSCFIFIHEKKEKLHTAYLERFQITELLRGCYWTYGQKVSFLAKHLGPKQAGCPLLGWEKVIRKDLKEVGTPWEEVRCEALKRLRGSRSMPNCVGLR